MRAELEQLKQQALNDFYFFSKGILEFEDISIQPHKRLCDFLQSCYKHSSTRILVLMPRGWFKTTVCTVSYPLWLTLHNPNLRFLLISEREDNAIHYLSLIRQLIEKRYLLRVFLGLEDGTASINEDSRTKLTLPRSRISKEGTFEVVGVGGTVVGRHYDYLIKDDIVGPQSANDSQATEAALRWHKFSYSLLESPSKNVDMIVGVRWGRGDFYEHILNQGSYETFILGAYDEKGKSTFPSRFSEETLERIRREQGPEIFGAQYKLECIDVESALFKREWLRRVEIDKSELEKMYIVMAVDPALSTKDSRDPTAISVVGKAKDTYYILDAQAKRLSISSLIPHLLSLHEKWKPHRIVVESTAFQRLLAHDLRLEAERRALDIHIVEFVPSKKKKLRIMSLEPHFASGRVRVCGEFPDFEDQYLSYPKVTHDDILDSLATAFMHLPEYSIGDEDVRESEYVRDEIEEWEEGRSVVTGY